MNESIPSPLTITPFSIYSMGATAQAGLNDGLGSATWPAANRAIYTPFRVPVPWTMKQIAWANGATVTGNMCIGIYTASGIQIYTSGSTAMSGASALQTVNPTDQDFDAGLYYLGLSGDSAVNCTVLREVPSLQRMSKVFGLAEEASAFPLPATATFATHTSSGLIPYWVITALATL